MMKDTFRSGEAKLFLWAVFDATRFLVVTILIVATNFFIVEILVVSNNILY